MFKVEINVPRYTRLRPSSGVSEDRSRSPPLEAVIDCKIHQRPNDLLELATTATPLCRPAPTLNHAAGIPEIAAFYLFTVFPPIPPSIIETQ